MKQIFFAALILLAGVNAFSQEALRKKEFNLSKNGLAINGYDPVAYFKQNKAIEGSSNFATVYQGATYYFSSAENKEEFKKNPAKYEPQYGGWCAYAMGKNGEKVAIDPETFKIIDGKLFLFYNRFFNNTLKSWNKDEANLHTKADTNWKKIFQ
ncbi:MAG: YHS domain-containing protein [Sphingobacteriales bacterium]|nr:YHS domain-containing protein [Sphingobacteriales bacterium]